MIITNDAELQGMRVAGSLAARVLQHIEQFVTPGITTNKLDSLCHDYIVDELESIPASLNYKGFPKSVCISPNRVVCHGIPSEKVLKKGDIINIDVGLIKDGFYGDTSKMFFVGQPSVLAKRLVEATYQGMIEGIKQVAPGKMTSAIGYTIEKYINQFNYSVVRDYGGHGVGRVYHEDPQIAHFGTNSSEVRMVEGMVFTIEPMINVGDFRVKRLPDNWTVVTKDHRLSAQFEHTILVTSSGFEVLTLRDDEDPLLW